MTKKVELRIEGLDCAEEVAVLRKAVGTRKGVVALDFNLLDARMIITYAPADTNPEELMKAVATAGMRASLWQTKEEPQKDTYWQAHGRLVMVSISGLCALAGVLLHWHMHGSLSDALHTGEQGVGHRTPFAVAVLFVGSIISGAWYVAPRALISARKLRPDMNLLMTIAVIGAVIIQEWLEASMVSFLFAVAVMLEHWSVGRARRAIAALMEIAPETARRRDPDTGELTEIRVEDVTLNEQVLVRPGERIPLDGRIVNGNSSVNQARITGESMPVHKGPGDEVYAGTINEEGVLEITVTRGAGDTTLSHIIKLVSEAHSRRAPSEQWVEKFARYYTPTMMFLALACFTLPPLLMGGEWPQWLYRALVILVIACPCALVISTPVSFVSALTASARQGVLIKGGAYLEGIGQIRAVALDKTGTLTHGRPEVQRIVALAGHTNREVLEDAAALEAHSDHPIARAILRAAAKDGIEVPPAENFRVIKGEGAEGIVRGVPHWIGSHRMMDTHGQETQESHETAEMLADVGHSVVTLGNDKHVCGVISVADEVRPDAAANVAALNKAGIDRIVMLTGDNTETATAIAGSVGIEEFRAELLPEDKVTAVTELVRESGGTAMVGDGINDAPAMAAASVGIAMGAMGADAAIETADIALMSDDLSRIPWLIRHSRRTMGVVKQNIFFALGLKAAFMALAVMGIATLWMAIAADTGASLLVIFNGLRLLKAGKSN